MSAIEALKARQRGAATSPTQKAQPTSESEEQPVMSSANRFNLLRKDSSQNATPKSPRKSAAKDPRLQRGVESPASRSRGTAVAGYVLIVFDKYHYSPIVQRKYRTYEIRAGWSLP